MLLVCTGASASHRVFDRCHVVANGSFRCRRPGRRQLCRSGNSAGSGLEEQELRKARPPRQPDQLLRADEPLTEPGHSGPVVGMDPFIAVGNPFVGNPSSVTDVILDYKGSLQLLGTSLLDVEATISCVLSVIIVGACHHNLLETGSQGLNANPSAVHFAELAARAHLLPAPLNNLHQAASLTLPAARPSPRVAEQMEASCRLLVRRRT